MSELGKVLIVIGCLLAALGVVLVFSDKIPWLGKLPGDISIKRENFSFYFPLATCILISLILSLLFSFFRK
jgi:cell division protein FtsW (lipid II flippase)